MITLMAAATTVTTTATSRLVRRGVLMLLAGLLLLAAVAIDIASQPGTPVVNIQLHSATAPLPGAPSAAHAGAAGSR